MLPTRNAPPRSGAQRRSRKLDDRFAAEAAQVLLGSEHRAPERVVAERRAVDQVRGDRRRLVVGAGDLLDHHAALALELASVDPRTPGDVGQQVDRLGRGLGAEVMWKATRSWLV